MGVIWYDGKSSRDFGIIIEKYPQSCHATRRGEAYQIAGRNGTYYAEDGTYDNYTQPYRVNIREGNYRRADLRCQDIAAWLLGPSDFVRLEDSFEPEVYRLARYAGPLNVDQILGRWGQAQLEFECLPERWLLSGEQAQDVCDTSTAADRHNKVYNPTRFTARPLLRIAGTGTLAVTINGTHYLDINGGTSGIEAFIDCEARTIKDSSGNDIPATFYTRYHEFPSLPSGTSNFSVGVTVSVYECTPRWWTL